MKCPNCGEENPEDSLFCQSCGGSLTQAPTEKEESEKQETKPEENQQEVQEESVKEQAQQTKEPEEAVSAQNEEPKKDSKNKLGYAVIAIAAIVVICILVLLVKAVSGGSSSKNLKIKNSIQFFYNDEDEEQEIVVGSNKIVGSITESISDSQSSITGDSSVVLDYEGTLYYVSTSEVTTIAEEVQAFEFAVNGDAVAYIDEEGTLQLYTVSDKKKTKVDSDLEINYMAISPDGKALIYVEGDRDDYDLYYYYKGKKEKLEGSMYPIAVSNSASYIYAYSEDNDALYLLDTKGNKSKLGADMSGSFVLNKDHSELIFTADGKNYITVKGGEKVKIGSSYGMYPLMVSGSASTYRYDQYVVITCGLSTFKGSILYNTDGDVYKLNKNLETDRIVGSASGRININNKTLFYLKNNNLYKISMEEDAESVKLAEDVTSFCVTSDGNIVYYITEDSELRYIKGNKDSKKIADDVYTMSISGKDVLFFLTDYAKNSGTLYYSKNGSEKKRIADDVAEINVTTTGVFYYEDDGDDLYNVYSSNGNEKFEKILENIGY